MLEPYDLSEPFDLLKENFNLRGKINALKKDRDEIDKHIEILELQIIDNIKTDRKYGKYTGYIYKRMI